MSNDTQVQAHMALVDQYMSSSKPGYLGWFGSTGEARTAVEASARQLSEQGAPGLSLLREARATLEMWKDVAPAVSLCSDIDRFLATRPLTASPTAPQADRIAPGWTAEEIEEVICCLDDDAVTLLDKNPEDERALNMQRAACMIQVLSQRVAPPTSPAEHKELKPCRHGHIHCLACMNNRAPTAPSTEASEPVPDGYRLIAVTKFDPLVMALDRAFSKGYLPDALEKPWSDFDWEEVATPPPAPVLSDAEIEQAVKAARHPSGTLTPTDLARAIEQAIGRASRGAK